MSEQPVALSEGPGPVMTRPDRPARADAAAFAGLAQDLFEAPGIDDVLARAVAFAGTALAGDCAGMVVWPGQGLHQRRSVASDWRVAAAGELERVLGEGPGEPAPGLRPGDKVNVGDTAADGRWPRWGPLVAAQFGLRSVLSVPLAAGRPIGVLILYATKPDAFAAPDDAGARLTAIHTATAVASAITAANLWDAMEAHSRIGQATGLLMERFGLEADAALAMLRTQSQDHNINMRTIAEALLCAGEQQRSVRRRAALDTSRVTKARWTGDVMIGSRSSGSRRVVDV